jgi:hypothetical protein
MLVLALENCGFNAASAGLVDFTFGSAFGTSVTPDVAGALAGLSYSYIAMYGANQQEWEKGNGLYSGASNIARTVISESSNANAKVNFSGAPRVHVAGPIHIPDVALAGTFVPTLTINNGTTGIVYAVRLGRYMKTGNMIYFEINIVLSNKGSRTGELAITGLPFLSNNSCDSVVSMAADALNSASGVIGSFQPGVPKNTTVIGMEYMDTAGGGGGSSTMTNAHLNNTSLFTIAGCYIAA